MSKRKLWRPNAKDDYVNAILGRAPEDFNETIVRAQKIASLAGEEFGMETILIDELLVAALAHVQAADHPRAYPVNRIRQINEWLIRKEGKSTSSHEPDSPDALSSKLRAISDTVMQMLYRTESFLLLITDHRLDSVYHSSSIDRLSQIAMLKNHLAQLESEQADKS